MSKLIGDELHVTPQEFITMQKTIIDAMGENKGTYNAALEALRAVGLNEAQIESRYYRETKILVVFSWMLDATNEKVITTHNAHLF